MDERVVAVGHMRAILEWCSSNDINPITVIKICSDGDEKKIMGIRGYKVVYLRGAYNVGSGLRAQIELRSMEDG